jgi:hypothetical protein
MTQQLDDALTQFTNAVPNPLRAIVGVFGGALASAGAVAVFATANSAGAASLVVAGAAIGALAMFANSVQRVKAGSFELVLTAVRLDKAAEDAERKGQSEEASKLRGQAALLMLAAHPVASELDRLRRELSPGPERTRLLDGHVQIARQAAEGFRDDAGPALEDLFETGTDGERMFVIGVMQGKPQLASAQVAEAALVHNRSKTEQFHALRLIAEMIKINPKSTEVARLRRIVEEMLADEKFAEGTGRRSVAEVILGSH